MSKVFELAKQSRARKTRRDDKELRVRPSVRDQTAGLSGLTYRDPLGALKINPAYPQIYCNINGKLVWLQSIQEGSPEQQQTQGARSE